MLINHPHYAGGASITNQRERLDPKINGFAFKYGGAVDVLIATPGRLLEHIESTEGFCERLKGVEVLVLDEVDMLLDGGFQRAIEAIIQQLPKARQTLCFSATVPARLLPVLHLAMQDDHIVVDCVGEEEEETHAKIEQAVVVHALEHSLLALYQSIMDEIERRLSDYKIIVFLPTARATQFYAAVMKKMDLNVLEIHSRASQGERTLASDTFRNHSKVILLSSGDQQSEARCCKDEEMVLTFTQLLLFQMCRRAAWTIPTSLWCCKYRRHIQGAIRAASRPHR